MMPELGRSLTHKEGVALITHYILTLKGACEREEGPGYASFTSIVSSAWRKRERSVFEKAPTARQAGRRPRADRP